MHPRLGCIPVQPFTVAVTRKSVHDSPANTAVAVDLEPQVIVCAGERVVVLMDDKVSAVGGASVAGVERGVGGDGEEWLGVNCV